MQIVYYLRGKGHVVGKTKTMGVVRNGRYTLDRYCFRGFPDLACFCPKLVFVECKSANGKHEPAQKDFQGFCQKAGVTYILARRLEDVSDVIK